MESCRRLRYSAASTEAPMPPAISLSSSRSRAVTDRMKPSSITPLATPSLLVGATTSSAGAVSTMPEPTLK